MWSTGGCHIFGEWWFAIQWKKVKDIKLLMLVDSLGDQIISKT